MTRQSRPRRLLAVAGCAAVTVGALTGTAAAASASGTHTTGQAGGAGSSTVATNTLLQENAVTGGTVTIRAVTPAVSYLVVQIRSWDGACLTIPVANVGTRLEQVPCGQDHFWWLNPSTLDLYPEGHANVQVGDSGGYLELKGAGTGTALDEDAVQDGTVNGQTYAFDELSFGVPGTYWHANGSGEDVTFDSEAGDLANYWALIQQ